MQEQPNFYMPCLSRQIPTAATTLAESDFTDSDPVRAEGVETDFEQSCAAMDRAATREHPNFLRAPSASSGPRPRAWTPRSWLAAWMEDAHAWWESAMDDDDENEEGTGGPCTGAPTGEDGGAQRDGGGGGEPNPPTECSELVLSPTGHAETLREYLSPGGEAVSAGFENGDDECFYDKSELPANGDGGWVKDVGSCARGGAG